MDLKAWQVVSEQAESSEQHQKEGNLMAESTRFKTLEEQIKKQEIRIQEVIEGLQSSQLQQ